MPWTDGRLERSLLSTGCCRRRSCDQAQRAVKVSPLAKRKRKAAGRKVAPLIATPNVPSLNDTEWRLFSQWLPSQPQDTLVRGELDRLMITYLGILEAEATSPSAREVATVL